MRPALATLLLSLACGGRHVPLSEPTTFAPQGHEWVLVPIATDLGYGCSLEMELTVRASPATLQRLYDQRGGIYLALERLVDDYAYNEFGGPEGKERLLSDIRHRLEVYREHVKAPDPFDEIIFSRFKIQKRIGDQVQEGEFVEDCGTEVLMKRPMVDLNRGETRTGLFFAKVFFLEGSPSAMARFLEAEADLGESFYALTQPYSNLELENPDTIEALRVAMESQVADAAAPHEFVLIELVLVHQP
jgi:hypothetical protein